MGVDGGKRSKPRPGRFTPRGKRPGRHCTGGWVGPRARLDGCEKCHSHSIAGLSSPERVAIPTALSRPTHHKGRACNT
jgi:hypothetical protein